MNVSSFTDMELGEQCQHLDSAAPPSDVSTGCCRFNDFDNFGIADEEDDDEGLSDVLTGPPVAAVADASDGCCCHQLPPQQRRRGCANSLSSLATTCSTSSCSSSAWEDNAKAAAASAAAESAAVAEDAVKAMDLQQQLHSSMRSLQLGQLLAPACEKSSSSSSVHRDSRQLQQHSALRLGGRPAGVCSRRRSSAISARSKDHYLAQYKADKLGYFNSVVNGVALVREQHHRRLELNSWR